MRNEKKQGSIPTGGVGSLKFLAENLRSKNETDTSEVKNVSTESKETEEKPKQELNIRPEKKWDLEQFINYSKQTKFDCNAVAYIDQRVKNVFAQIKVNGKSVNIGKLMTVILDQWIEDHRDEIISLIDNNKYI